MYIRTGGVDRIDCSLEFEIALAFGTAVDSSILIGIF